jgi:transposase
MMLERPFAHCYETGGMRRVYLRGRENILKRLIIHVGAFNLSLVLRESLGKGTPRGLQDLATLHLNAIFGLLKLLSIDSQPLWLSNRPLQALCGGGSGKRIH